MAAQKLTSKRLIASGVHDFFHWIVIFFKLNNKKDNTYLEDLILIKDE